MKDETRSISFLTASMVTMIFNGAFMVFKESNEPLEDVLKSAFGHHWIRHGVVLFTGFLLISSITCAILKGRDIGSLNLRRWRAYLVGSTLLMFAIILGSSWWSTLPSILPPNFCSA